MYVHMLSLRLPYLRDGPDGVVGVIGVVLSRGDEDVRRHHPAGAAAREVAPGGGGLRGGEEGVAGDEEAQNGAGLLLGWMCVCVCERERG